MELAKARDHLTAVLDAPPTVAELAAYLELAEDEVIDGLVAANGYTAGSIDLPAEEGEGDRPGRSYAETVGAADPAMSLIEDFHALAPLLSGLDEHASIPGVIEVEAALRVDRPTPPDAGRPGADGGRRSPT